MGLLSAALVDERRNKDLEVDRIWLRKECQPIGERDPVKQQGPFTNVACVSCCFTGPEIQIQPSI